MLSRAQQGHYRRLVDEAYDIMRTRLVDEIPSKDAWRRKINLDTCGKYSTKQMSNSDFDLVMLELAVIADDDYWIGRCSTNDVRQLRWIMERQFIPDLEVLEHRKVEWAYIQAICKQANFPTSIIDCPAPMLRCVMQAVDTHIRRLAKRNGVALADLPSGPFRKGIRPANKALAIFRHDHHHHINHAA